MSEDATEPQLPAVLPAKPEGFTRRIATHLNFGSKGSSAVYDLFAPSGAQMPVHYMVQTGKGKKVTSQGFYFVHSEECLTWEQLRGRWVSYMKARARIIAAGKKPATVMKHANAESPLQMIVIYDRPKDLPNGFVARTWNVLPDKVIPGKLLGHDLASLEAARELVPHGFVNIGRNDDDDAKIVEVWL
jgi:hypothetical protein